MRGEQCEEQILGRGLFPGHEARQSVKTASQEARVACHPDRLEDTGKDARQGMAGSDYILGGAGDSFCRPAIPTSRSTVLATLVFLWQLCP